MLSKFALPAVAAWLSVCGWAAAHGPQIQLTGDTGKIVTRRIIADEPYSPLTPETRIYVIPVVEVGGNWFVKPPTATTSGPGLAVGWGHDEDSNNHPFQTGDYTLKIADALLKWNGASFADAGAAQLRANKGTTTATTTDSGPFASLTWPIAVDDVDAHSGMTYRFLGNGSSSTSELLPGVYLLSLQVAHGSLVDSETFYYVLPTAGSLSEAKSAAHFLADLHDIGASAIQVVPEPTAVVLASMAFAGLLRRRRA